jgi:hypothetical protein
MRRVTVKCATHLDPQSAEAKAMSHDQKFYFAKAVESEKEER